MEFAILYGRNRERVAPRLEKDGLLTGSVLLLKIRNNHRKLFMKIYCLRDETRFLRYVGKTSITLPERLKGHIREALDKTPSGSWKSNTHKSRWIRSMLRRGLTPSIDLITEVKADGNKAEIAYIAYFKRKGIELVNGTSGGDGGGPGEGNPNYGNHILAGRKRPEHSKWMTEHNSFAGKHHKEESIKQLKASIRKGFENGRVGYWKGKKMPPHKEGCRCASCMSKRGEGYEWDHTKLPPPTEQTRLKMGEAHKRHREDCKCIACMAKRGEFYKRKMK
jgi:hypothetical protein